MAAIAQQTYTDNTILSIIDLDGEQRGPLSTQVSARDPPLIISLIGVTQLYDPFIQNTLMLIILSKSCIFYDIIATLLRGVQLVASTWLVLIVVQSLSLNNRCLKFFLYAMFCTMNIAVTVFGIITLKEIYRKFGYM